MKSTWFTTAVVSALALALGAAPAFAADPAKNDKAKGATSQPGKTGATDPGTTSKDAAKDPASAAGDFTARHTMTGEVTRVDQKKGTMSLKTQEGTLDLHFPPSALANVKKGDRVTVELALKPEGGPAASPRSEGPAKSNAGTKQ